MSALCSISWPSTLPFKQSEREWERLLDRERAARDELAEVDRRKDEFLAMLGHELRDPLSAIVMAIEVLEQRACHDLVTFEMHGVLRRQSQHMTKLIDDLLDKSRINSGKITLQIDRLDFIALTKDVVADHQYFLDANQLTLVFEQSDMPIWLAQQLADVVTAGTRLKSFDTVILVGALISWECRGIACRPKLRNGSLPWSTKIIRLPTRR